jgi:hypothetical protein
MSNRSQVFLDSVAGRVAGTYTSETFFNPDGDALHASINIGAITAGSLTVFIEAYDMASGLWYVLLQSAALAAASAGTPTVLKVLPTGVATANLVANDCLPEKIRIRAVVATGPCTFSIGGAILGA